MNVIDLGANLPTKVFGDLQESQCFKFVGHDHDKGDIKMNEELELERYYCDNLVAALGTAMARLSSYHKLAKIRLDRSEELEAVNRNLSYELESERDYCENLVMALRTTVGMAKASHCLTEELYRRITTLVADRDEARAAYRAASDRLIARDAMLENQTWD